MLLAHHAFILPLSYRHLYLFTAVTRPDHIREQRLPRPWATLTTAVNN